MSEIVEVPSWLVSKTGEEITQNFADWIASTKQKLLRSFPPGERAFCRILDKMKSRLPRCWQRRLHYTRQKHFLIAPSVVFFGDFFLGNANLLIEIDGQSHGGKLAQEKDQWRAKLISAWKVSTARLTNDQATGMDFRVVEKWIVDQTVASCPPARGLISDYNDARRRHPSIYNAVGNMTTYR